MQMQIYFILLLACTVAAKTISNESILIIDQVFIITGIILTSILVATTMIGFVYTLLKCLKRKLTAPQYYIEENPPMRDANQYNPGYDDSLSQIPNIMNIKPSLSVPHMVASVKQSMIDLGHSLKPSK